MPHEPVIQLSYGSLRPNAAPRQEERLAPAQAAIDEPLCGLIERLTDPSLSRHPYPTPLLAALRCGSQSDMRAILPSR